MKISFDERDEAVIVRLPPVVEVQDHDGAEDQIKVINNAKNKVCVVDFSKVTEVKSPAYRLLNMLSQKYSKDGRLIFWMLPPSNILAEFYENGHVNMVPTVDSVEAALKHCRPSKTVIDVDFIGPFIVATKKVLEVQAHTKLTQGKAYLRKGTDSIPMDIAGVLDLNNKNFRGTISIYFRAAVFLLIYNKMVGETITEINSEIKTAVGELLNIIYGQAKTVLNNQKGYQLQAAIPAIVVGDKLAAFQHGRGSAIVLPFEGEFGTFHLEILVDRV